MNKINQIIGMLVFISIFGFALSYYLVESVFLFEDLDIEIVGNDLHHESYKKSLWSHFKSEQGKPLFNMNIEKIYKKIKLDSRFENVQIQRRFPHKIRIKVQYPNTPFLYLDENGQLFPVSESGRLLPEVSLNESEDVPLLRGKELLMGVDKRKKVMAFFKHLPEKGWLSKDSLSEISWHSKDGLELFLKNGGHKVLLGPEHQEAKILKVERVLNYLHKKELVSRVIDGRFSKKVVVRPRNNP